MLFAQKTHDPTSFLEIMRGPTMQEWSHARFEGFDVEAGSPADKIMQRLVREGGAVKMAAEETFDQPPRRRSERYH